MQRIFKRCAGLALSAALAVTLLSAPGSAQSPQDFFKGKTLRLMHVTGPGGTMDLYALMVIKYMQRHLPEDTKVVLEHRPGGGGMVGTNHLYNAAPKDGTYMAMPTPSVVLLTFARPEAVRYEADKLIPLGRLIHGARVFVARGDSGIKTMKDAINIETTHATMPPGATPHTVAVAANEILGTKFRVVPGYNGGGPMFVAMEQGEVQSTTAEPGNLLANKWDQVRDGRVNVLAVAGGEPIEGFENTPLWTEFVPSDHPLRGVVDAVSGGAKVGLSLFYPPGVPDDRVAYMRDVIKKTMNDPDLISEAKGKNVPLQWGSPDVVAQAVRESANQPDNVKQWFVDARKKK